MSRKKVKIRVCYFCPYCNFETPDISQNSFYLMFNHISGNHKKLSGGEK
jgi:hypothetical protein